MSRGEVEQQVKSSSESATTSLTSTQLLSFFFLAEGNGCLRVLNPPNWPLVLGGNSENDRRQLACLFPAALWHDTDAAYNRSYVCVRTQTR